MIITITGLPGSGKSTIAKLIAKQLEYPHYSMGDLRGKMALDRGMTIDELNKLGETEDFTDKEVDDYQSKLGRTESDFIVDGRLSWYFIPHSFKIFLDVDSTVGAKRVYEDDRSKNRQDEPHYQSLAQAKEVIGDRILSDQKRYQKYYQINFLDKTNYDLVINTTHKTIEEITQLITEAIQGDKA